MSETAATYNPGNERHVKHRKRREDRERERVEEAQKWVLATVQGRRFVWWLIGEAGVFKNPFTGNSTTDFNCGRGDVGRRLMSVLEEVDPENYLKMWSEHLKIKADDKRLEQAAIMENGANG